MNSKQSNTRKGKYEKYQGSNFDVKFCALKGRVETDDFANICKKNVTKGWFTEMKRNFS